MRDLLLLVIRLLVTVAKLLRPGGARAVAAESLLLKHQLVIINRSRQRAPNLTCLDRFVLGLTTVRKPPPYRESRRDPAITTKIKAAFAKDKQVSALKINVDTDNKGMVALSGTAKSQAEADRAVAIARETSGMTSVINNIQVSSGAK